VLRVICNVKNPLTMAYLPKNKGNVGKPFVRVSGRDNAPTSHKVFIKNMVHGWKGTFSAW
jgi:hypothetical protein